MGHPRNPLNPAKATGDFLGRTIEPLQSAGRVRCILAAVLCFAAAVQQGAGNKPDISWAPGISGIEHKVSAIGISRGAGGSRAAAPAQECDGMSEGRGRGRQQYGQVGARTPAQVEESEGREPEPARAEDRGEPPAKGIAKTTPPPRYTTFLPPARGASYRNLYGATIERLSDSTRDGSRWTEAEYATQNHFNADDTKIFVDSDSHLRILDLSGALLSEFPHIGTSSEPMWDHDDPDRLWYHIAEHNSLRYIDVLRGKDRLERTFQQYKFITGKGESDISPDGRKMVLLSDTGDIFVYNLRAHTKGPVLNIGTSAVDWLQVSNNFVVIGFDSFAGNRAVRVYDLNMRFERQLASFLGHEDVGLDLNGHEVLVMSTSDNRAAGNCVNSLVKYRLLDGNATCLAAGNPAFSWSLSMHVALPAKGNGWVYLSTEAPGDPQPGTPEWAPYTNEILRIKLDGSSVIERLAHHYSRPYPGNTYEWQPRASVNATGTMVLFNSTYGLHYKLAKPPATRYVDTYLLTVPDR